MNVDIIFKGFLISDLVKIKSKKYFKEMNFKQKNNVFFGCEKDFVVHAKKNTIHIYSSNQELHTIKLMVNYIDFLFGTSFIGIKTSDDIYRELKKNNGLNFVRM